MCDCDKPLTADVAILRCGGCSIAVVMLSVGAVRVFA